MATRGQKIEHFLQRVWLNLQLSEQLPLTHLALWGFVVHSHGQQLMVNPREVDGLLDVFTQPEIAEDCLKEREAFNSCMALTFILAFRYLIPVNAL